MSKTPQKAEQPLRRSSRLSGTSPVPTRLGPRTRRSSTDVNPAEVKRKAPLTRRLSLDHDNLSNNVGKLQSLASPSKRVTNRSSITINGDAGEKTNGDNNNAKNLTKNGTTPEKHLDSIEESNETQESPSEVKSNSKSPKLSANLSAIKEEKKSPIVLITNLDTRTDANHENVSMEIDTTITEIIIEKTPTKNPYVSLNNTHSTSPKTESSNHISSLEKNKTRTSPRRNNIASSTPSHPDVKKILFTEDDETSEDSKKLNRKLDNLMQGVLAESSDEEVEEEEEETATSRCPFIDDEAEEGEEVTPPDDSNEIIDYGEEINSEDSSFSNDESYELDSMIDPNENLDASLLSGDEYDLSIEELRKQAESLQKSRSRIIGLTSGSDDDDIVIIKRRKKKEVKRKRKSRIIRPVDDSQSDEENQQVKTESEASTVPVEEQNGVVSVVKIEGLEEEEESPKKCSSIIILENIRIDNLSNEGLSEHIQQVVADVRSDMPAKGEVSLNVTLDYFENNKEPSPSASPEVNKENISTTSPVENESSSVSQTVVAEKLPVSERSKRDKDEKDAKKKRKRTRSKKRKHKSPEKQVENRSSPTKKQKKNNVVASSQVKEVKKMGGIVDMALAGQRDRLQVIKPDASNGSISEKWLVDTLEKKSKPSKKSKLKKRVTENLEKKVELAKAAAAKSNTGMKFHVKDFKNRMLYDPERSHRVDTKVLLSKKGVYLF